MNYIKRGEACDKLNIHYVTLLNMAERKEIETIQIGKQQLYNVEKFMKEKGIIKNMTKRKICYCRVSSRKQIEDLNRQIEVMKITYPTYEIIKDIGSGLNYNRPGLLKIINYAMEGEIEEVIVAYKDRLTRFGYELIEYIIKEKSGGKITIINNIEEKTPTEELTTDILSIMNVYVAKMNGLRKYKKLIKEELCNTK
jgi:predicted site-specific integrase-resolvase